MTEQYSVEAGVALISQALAMNVIRNCFRECSSKQ
jgi:hypothetical protein